LGQYPLTVPSGLETAHREDETIYQLVSSDRRFTKITKAIQFAEGIQTILDDVSTDVTFFAVPDSALRRSSHDGRFGRSEDLYKINDLSDALHVLDKIENTASGGSDCQTDDDDDHERRKRILKKVVTAILSYHILPSKYSAGELSNNNTFATNLVLPDWLDKRPLRIRVASTLVPPMMYINFYSKVSHTNIPASNGMIHQLNAPLLPPPPVFQELFIMPSVFSTFTSAVQRVGLTDAIDLRLRDRDRDGARSVTVFTPSNHAFHILPRKLKLFLFSPFGARALRKLLQYHIVPNYIFHTEYHFNQTAAHQLEDNNNRIAAGALEFYLNSADGDAAMENIAKFAKSMPEDSNHHHELITSYHLHLPTALENHSIHAHVEKTRVSFPIPGPRKPHQTITKLSVNDRTVALPDIVGLNGAFHVIDRVLDPRHGHCRHHGHKHYTDDEDSWDDWEDWLTEWAENV